MDEFMATALDEARQGLAEGGIPIGSVLVYGSRRGAGHVEIRTRRGFVSDFRASAPSRRPLIGVYAKIDSPKRR